MCEGELFVLFSRPFEMLLGVLFSSLGFLLFLSLLLTNIDKALHSGGPCTGYALQVQGGGGGLQIFLIQWKRFELNRIIRCGENFQNIPKNWSFPSSVKTVNLQWFGIYLSLH